MNKDLHNIDDLFRNSIDGHAEEVPPDVWKNIDHGLDKKQAAFYKRKYFAVRAAAILVILIGGVTIAAILHFNQRQKISQGESSNGNIVTTSKGRGQNVKEEKAPQLETQKSVSDQNETVTDQNVVLKKQEGNIVDETK